LFPNILGVHLFEAQKPCLSPSEIHAIWSIFEQHTHIYEKKKCFIVLMLRMREKILIQFGLEMKVGHAFL